MGVRVHTSGEDLLKNQYFRVPINLYQAGDLIEEDLYFLYQGNYLLYRLKNLIWKADDQQKLEAFSVDHLYIRCETEREHNKFLESKLKFILEQPLISNKEKAEIIYGTTQSLLEELFEKPDSPENLRRSMASVQHSITHLSKDRENFFELMSLATKDFSEFTHGLHVAAYSIMLARQMGIKSFNQSSAIGIAAILHDIGKTRIDQKLLEKEENLSSDERKVIELHPVYSYEIVHRAGVIPALSEMAILQHHEKPNGKGYPSGLTNELHTFAKIVALCDCFDLLTSERTYKKALSPVEAIEWLRNEGKTDYDPNLLVEFIKMLRR